MRVESSGAVDVIPSVPEYAAWSKSQIGWPTPTECESSRASKRFELRAECDVLRTHHIARSQQAATRRCLPQCCACRAVRSASKAADAAPLVSCAETEADEGSSKVDSRMIHGV